MVRLLWFFENCIIKKHKSATYSIRLFEKTKSNNSSLNSNQQRRNRAKNYKTVVNYKVEIN